MVSLGTEFAATPDRRLPASAFTAVTHTNGGRLPSLELSCTFASALGHRGHCHDANSGELLLDPLTGAPSIHGFSAHIGLMVAGVVGVALGSRFLRPSRRTRPPAADENEIEKSSGKPEHPDTPPAPRSRLTRANGDETAMP